jgi:predicted aspartyl protease
VTEEIHDMSRVDSFMASRRRAMFFHSVWKPMLAGAVGAALMTAAVIGSVWVILPKISTREVVVDHVIQHDVPFDNHTPQDKPFDNYVPHDKPFDVPKPTPQAALPPPQTAESAPPATPAEKKFVSRPEYESAEFKGRLVYDKDGYIRFDNGRFFVPPTHDKNGMAVEDDYSTPDPDSMYDTAPFWGDLAFCNKIPAKKYQMKCLVIHNDMISDLAMTWRRKTANDRPCAYGYKCDTTAADAPKPPLGQTTSNETKSANTMVMVDVNVAGYPVEAMVDTGCSFPMVIPETLADALIKRGLAVKAGTTSSMLADGKVSEVGVILIRSITVDGRTLDTVEASVSPGNNAPILLGLGALNRLGPYSIQEGRLVFTGEQPA